MVAHVVRPTDLIRARPTAIQHGRDPLFSTLAFPPFVSRVRCTRRCTPACVRACASVHLHERACIVEAEHRAALCERHDSPKAFTARVLLSSFVSAFHRLSNDDSQSSREKTRATLGSWGKKRKAIFIVRLTCQNSATCPDVLLLLAETNLRRVTVVCSSRIRRSTPSLKSCQRSRKH